MTVYRRPNDTSTPASVQFCQTYRHQHVFLKIRKNIHRQYNDELEYSFHRMGRSQTFNNHRDLSNSEQRIAFHRPLSEDRIIDQMRNPQNAYREAMQSIANDDWEQKCSGLTLIQNLLAQYPDIITQNLHQVVLILIAEVIIVVFI